MEATKVVIGHELHGKWERTIAEAHQIIFVPSAHLGPYVGMFASEGTLWLLFGARLPEGAPSRSSALSRSDLLVRLSEINDDTRLRILELLSRNEELCSQDIIAMLDLTQSAASRHLKQLSASGYVAERRRDGNKCYSLNRERIDDTFRALGRFLDGE
jgi:DNA-binding transcriptional ArsR family regulator